MIDRTERKSEHADKTENSNREGYQLVFSACDYVEDGMDLLVYFCDPVFCFRRIIFLSSLLHSANKKALNVIWFSVCKFR